MERQYKTPSYVRSAVVAQNERYKKLNIKAVSVRIPAHCREQLLAIAAQFREDYYCELRSGGND